VRLGAGALLALAFAALPAAAEPEIRLAFPLACAPGPACFVQNYVDHDATRGYRDYRCGPLSSDGHRGTDIRLADFAAMRRGVAVLAAAPGVVVAVRDEMPDVDMRLVGRDAVTDRGLGNVVILRHAGGWRTIYAHMRRGSVAVTKGEAVVAGRRLGLVGLSGLTEFPHVHFEVRFGNRPVDPFVGMAAPRGCDAAGDGLWDAALRAGLAYRPTFLLRAGFATRPMTRPAMQYGLYRRATLSAKSGRLYFGAFAAGLYAGDRYALRVTGPDGAVLFEKTGVVARDRAVAFWHAGVARGAALPPGAYRARFTLDRSRDGVSRRILDIARPVTLN